MKIQFKSEHLSIKQFTDVELPSFVVLTGLNGSGKTHLLQAIKNGNVVVDDVPVTEIDFYTYHDFAANLNQGAMNGQQIDQQRINAWQALSGQAKPNVNWFENLRSIYQQCFVIQDEDGESVDLLEDGLPEDVYLWEAYDDLELVPEELRDRVRKYGRNVKTQVFQNDQFKKIGFAPSVRKTIKTAARIPHEITQEMFAERFVPSHNAERYLQTSLAAIFTKYIYNKFRWAYEEWQRRAVSASPAEMFEEYERKHRKPWDVVNEILTEIHSQARGELVFNFAISTPENDRVGWDSWAGYAFVPTLIDKNSGEHRDFGALSSGEKILLALAVSVYESRDGYSFPEVLLLDEVDASLHPSMTQALLGTLQSVFVQRGTKVILATHAPSTVAFAPEGSTYVLHKAQQPNKIEPRTNQEALEFVTEGYMTLQNGMNIFNEITRYPICIMSEGKNALYIKHALKLLGGHDDVGVFEGLKERSGTADLKGLFQIFSLAPLTKPLLFVWDCDAEDKIKGLVETQFTFKFSFPLNEENQIAKRGIENIFPESLFGGWSTTTTNSVGAVVKKDFEHERKQAFAQYILSNGTKDDFRGFVSLLNKLEEIKNTMNRGVVT